MRTVEICPGAGRTVGLSRLPAVIAAAMLLGFIWRADASEHLMRHIGVEQGLISESVGDIAQDREGFLWISTLGGLYRYDGTEMRPWSAGSGNRSFWTIATSPDGEIMVLDSETKIQRVTGSGLETVPVPEGQPPGYLRKIVFDATGQLWGLRKDGIIRRDRAGVWSVISAGEFGSERLRVLTPAASGGALIATGASVWKIEPDARRVTRLVTGLHNPYPLSLAGRVVVVASDKPFLPLRVLEIRDGQTRELARLPTGNVWDVQARGEIIWVSFERFLFAIRPDGTQQLIGPAEGLPSAGRMLIDSEGSLWLSTVRGLIQFPEPETMGWNESDGLPSVHSILMSRIGSGIALSTWAGLAWMTPSPSGWKVEVTTHTGRFCGDAEGRAWSAMTDGFLMRDAHGFHRMPVPGIDWSVDCTPAPDGRVWMATTGGLYLSPAGPGLPRRMDLSEIRHRAECVQHSGDGSREHLGFVAGGCAPMERFGMGSHFRKSKSSVASGDQARPFSPWWSLDRGQRHGPAR